MVYTEERKSCNDHDQRSNTTNLLWGVPETDYLKFYLFQIV